MWTPLRGKRPPGPEEQQVKRAPRNGDDSGKRKLTMLKPLAALLPPRVQALPKHVDDFYRSREWRALAADIKAKRGRFCERCGSGHRVIADHIHEMKDGGARLDPANIELLCQPCHNRKTAMAKARRSREG